MLIKFRSSFLESSFLGFYIQGFGIRKKYFSKNMLEVFTCFQHLSTEL